MVQTEKPMCSAKIEKTRLRRAIWAPPLRQKTGSSGRQSSIHRLPRLGARTCGASTAVVTVLMAGSSR
jgi:hypothetical protein